MKYIGWSAKGGLKNLGTEVVELSGSDMETLREAFDLYYENQLKTMIPETLGRWENSDGSVLLVKGEDGAAREREGSRMDGLVEDLDIDLEVLNDFQRMRKELRGGFSFGESDLGVIVYKEDAEKKIRENAGLLDGTSLNVEDAITLICGLLDLQNRPEKMVITEDE